MKIYIVDKDSLAILSRYEAASPQQSQYGGPWGDASKTIHLAQPEDVHEDDVSASLQMGEIVLEEDSDKKSARMQVQRDAKLEEMRKIRDAKLSEFDIMVNDLALGDRSDGAALKTYRQELKDITSEYKKVDGHAKAIIDGVDLEDEEFWPSAPVAP